MPAALQSPKRRERGVLTRKDLVYFDLVFLRQIEVFSETPSEPASWFGGGSEQILQVRGDIPVACVWIV